MISDPSKNIFLAIFYSLLWPPVDESFWVLVIEPLAGQMIQEDVYDAMFCIDIHAFHNDFGDDISCGDIKSKSQI